MKWTMKNAGSPLSVFVLPLSSPLFSALSRLTLIEECVCMPPCRSVERPSGLFSYFYGFPSLYERRLSMTKFLTDLNEMATDHPECILLAVRWFTTLSHHASLVWRRFVGPTNSPTGREMVGYGLRVQRFPVDDDRHHHEQMRAKQQQP